MSDDYHITVAGCTPGAGAAGRQLGGCVLFCLFWLALMPSVALAQESTPSLPSQDRPPPEDPTTSKTVDVAPVAQDAHIATRLQNILQATQWFEHPQVRVTEGVVFLQGHTPREVHRDWAGELAQRTQGVVAVVNRIELKERSIWNLSPAIDELRTLVQRAVQASPFLGFGLIVLGLSWGAARGVARLSRLLLRRRVANPLLREVTTRALSLGVFLLGLYLVLRVSGLTRLALTVLGGTGVAGLIIGIAFRDIMENFLASILLSMQQPFRSNDLVEVAGQLGFVQQVTTRGTVLMDFEGNHVQIPNATVYKEIIRNYTANPMRRSDFTVGIGYDAAIAHAQAVALQAISTHPAVLRDPEPLVLVESLGAATVNLRIFFWLDGNTHDWRKVKSAVIRLVKRAFQQAGIAMPDEARELLFPHGVPVRMVESQGDASHDGDRPQPASIPLAEAEALSTAAEGNLRSEEQQIQAQARQSRSPEGHENLLQT